MRKIATKVSKKLKKLKANKVIDLGEYREQRKELEMLFDEVMTTEKAIESGLDPLHAVYSHAQNLLSVLVELLSSIPDPSLDHYFDIIEAADDAYQPGFPPMSPLTKSYFTCWSMFDLAIGLQKETLTTIIIDMAGQLGLHKKMVEVFQLLQNSRMGIYEFLGHKGGRVLLRELTTDEVIPCICPAGYQGQNKGELWFARVLPPVYGMFDYSLVFITPYILLNPTTQGWTEYLNRTVSKKKSRTSASSLETLMKYGLSGGYWNEYIFQAYVNFKPEVVFLEGLPDVRASRPHNTADPKFASILPEAGVKHESRYDN